MLPLFKKKKNSCPSYKRSKWKITDTESELKYPGDNIKLLTVEEQSNRSMERLLPHRRLLRSTSPDTTKYKPILPPQE